MTNLIKQYNALDGTEATRDELNALSNKMFNAIGESAEHKAVFSKPHTKLTKLLSKFSDVNVFAITLSSKINTKGLNGAWHTGIKKDALDDCNRLKKGYKYDKGGKIVKVSKVKAKPKKASKPKGKKKISLIEQEKDVSKLSDLEIETIINEYASDITSNGWNDKYLEKIGDEKKKREATTKPKKNNNKSIKLDSDEALFILEDLPKKYEKAIFGSAFAELKRLAEKSSDKTLSTAAKNMLYLLKEDLFVLLNFKKGYERGSDKQEYRNVPTVYNKLLSKDLAGIKDVAVLDFLLRKTREYVYETAWSEYKFNGKDVFEISKILKFNIKSIEKQIEKLNTKTEETPEALGIPFLSKEQQKEFGDDETVGLGKAFGNNDVYQMVTDRILDAIEGYGDLTWYNGRDSEKGKDHFVNVARPINYNLNKYYRGINAFLLSHYPTLKEIKVIKGRKTKLIELTPITDNRLFWLTFKQIEAAKGKVKKGAISMEAVYYNFSYKLDGKNISEEKYKKLYKEFGCSPSKLDSDNCKRLEKNMFLRYYRVFNERDIENIDFEARRKKKADKAKKFVTVVEKIDAAEAVIDNMPNAPKIIEQHIGKGDSPHYDIMGDKVVMPLKMQYDDVSIWYGTAFHELVHSTGAEKRLSREGVTDFDEFGSPQYALEELIAELGSAYLNAESGIFLSTLKKNAAYIKGWKKAVVKLLQEDNKAIFKAAGQAQKAADYILDRDENGDPKFYKDLDKKTKPKAKKQSKKDAAQLALFAAAQKKKKNNGLGFAIQPLQPKNYVLISQDTQKKDGNEFEKGFSNVPPSDAISTTDDTIKKPERIENVAQAIKAVKKAINPGVNKYKTAAQVANEQKGPVNLFNIDGDLKKLLGNIEIKPVHSLLVTLDSEEGGGKTHSFYQWANTFASAGYSTIIWSLEEHKSSELSKSKCRKYFSEKAFNTIVVESENDGETPGETYSRLISSIKDFEAIFIDSLPKLVELNNRMNVDLELRKAFNGKIIFLILQRLSDGKPRGGSKASFDGDIILKVNVDRSDFRNNFVFNHKNRYNEYVPLSQLKYSPFFQRLITETEEPEPAEPKGFVIENF